MKSQVCESKRKKNKIDVDIVPTGEKGLNLNYAYEMRDVKFADSIRKKDKI